MPPFLMQNVALSELTAFDFSDYKIRSFQQISLRAGRQAFIERLKRIASYGEKIRPGPAVEKLECKSENLAWRQEVACKSAWRIRRREGLQFERFSAFRVRVGEENRIELRRVTGVFDGELVLCHHAQTGYVPLFKLGGERRSETVISSRGVSVTENKERCCRCCYGLILRSSTEPSASTSSTASGMLPSEWVAHERHGS